MNVPSLADLHAAVAAPIRARLLRRVRDPDIADDVLHETLLRAAKGVAKLRDLDRLGGFVWRIAERILIDRARRGRRTEPLPAESAEPAAPPAADAPPDLGGALRCGVDMLPREFGEALRLTAFDGLSQEALSKRLGLSPTGARSRVQRARGALRRLLEDCCRFEFDRRGRVVDAAPPAGGCGTACGCGDVPAAAPPRSARAPARKKESRP
jgi:RNA polymerase sigma-70 factor (ECF subfamily)